MPEYSVFVCDSYMPFFQRNIDILKAALKKFVLKAICYIAFVNSNA
jgi:hypothetical protein